MRKGRAALWSLAAAAVCLLALLAASRFGPQPPPESLALGEDGRALVLETGAGGRARLADYAGKPVVVLFWSRYCEMCVSELPKAAEMRALAEAAGAELVLAARINDDEQRLEAGQYLDGLGLGLETLYDRNSAVYHALGLTMTPSAAAFDAAGRLTAIIEGEAWTGEMLTALLAG